MSDLIKRLETAWVFSNAEDGKAIKEAIDKLKAHEATIAELQEEITEYSEAQPPI